MKKDIPTHSITEQFNSVIFAKRISPTTPVHIIRDTHRDKYSVIGFVISGCYDIEIDFKFHRFEAGDVIYVGSEQVHRLIDRHDSEARLLFIEPCLIDTEAKRLLDEYTLHTVALHASAQQASELERLFEILIDRIEQYACMEPGSPQPVLRHLAGAITGIVAEIVEDNRPHRDTYNRHTRIVLALNQRLAQHDAVDRNPSHHAAALNISTAYLNEAVHSVTGISARCFIAAETLLRAKRRLAYTTASIKEIAATLGFDDNAYFTRFFTKAEGVCPTVYRSRHIK